MASRPSRRDKRAGRPPAGARPGEKVLDYPQVSVRVPPEVKELLRTMSAATGMPQWRIVVDALQAHADRIREAITP